MAAALAEQLRETHTLLGSLIHDLNKAQPQTPGEEQLQKDTLRELTSVKDAFVKQNPEIILFSLSPAAVPIAVESPEPAIKEIPKPAAAKISAPVQPAPAVIFEEKKTPEVAESGEISAEDFHMGDDQNLGGDIETDDGMKNSFLQYMKDIRQFPLLNKEQEIDLGRKIFTAKLALRNLRFALETDSFSDNQKLIIQSILSDGWSKDLLNSFDREMEWIPTKIERVMQKKDYQESDTEHSENFLRGVKENDGSIKDRLQKMTADATSDFIKEHRIAIEEGEKAYGHFVNCNLRLSANIARRYYHWGEVPLLDIISYANRGLMTAVAKFDPETGNKFSTYATSWIRQTISRGIADNENPISLPIHVADALKKFGKEWALADQAQLGHIRFSEFVGEETPMSALIVNALNAKYMLSLDTPVGEEGDETLKDFIEAPGSSSSVVGDEAENNLLRAKLTQIMENALTPKERKILKLRFGLEDGRERTLEETGREFEISRERVRQIEGKALRKLRSLKITRELHEFL